MLTSDRHDSGEKTGSGRKKIDMDTLLVEEIGEFGAFQMRTLALALFVVVFAGWSSTEYVFTTARISTRCYIPECDSENPEFTTEWIQNAIPTSGSSLDNCQRYGNLSTTAPGPGVCPAELFDTSVLLPCEDYVYESTDTIVYNFELACDEWRRTLVGSMRTVGTLFCLPFVGYFSDRWGRRTVMIVSLINSAIIGVARYWANTYNGFIVSQVIESAVGSGGYTCAYILMTELVGPKYRLAVGAAMNTSFSVSQIIMALIAWGVPYWRHLTLTLYIPQFIIIAYFWLMVESVRWYLSKGKYRQAEDLLQKIARTNGKQLSSRTVSDLRQTAEDEKKAKAGSDVDKKSEPWLVALVFQNKSVLLRCVVSPVWWITSTFIYYGMSINSVNMSGNKYLNYMAVSAVEIPGYWTAVYLMGRVGRKPALIAAFWVCAACQVAYIFIPTDVSWASLTVYLIGKYSISVEVTTLYLYTAELYPTEHRHKLFAFSSMIGRVGGIIAPLTPAFGASTFEELPSVLFGSFALVSGFLVLLTPETRGTKLSDTMEDAENIGRNKSAA